MAIQRKVQKIKMNAYYVKEEKKTKIGNMVRTHYNFKLYWNDWKKYYVIRFNWNELMSMLLEAYIWKYDREEWTKRFEEFLELLRDIQKKWHNPFWLFIAKYIKKWEDKNLANK